MPRIQFKKKREKIDDADLTEFRKSSRIHDYAIKINISASVVCIGLMAAYSQYTIPNDCVENYIATRLFKNSTTVLSIFLGLILLSCFRYIVLALSAVSSDFADTAWDIIRILGIHTHLYKLRDRLYRLIRRTPKPSKTLIHWRIRFLGCYLEEFFLGNFLHYYSKLLSMASIAFYFYIIFAIVPATIRDFSWPGVLNQKRTAVTQCANLRGEKPNLSLIDPYQRKPFE